jgi:hypothetical protein
LKEINEQFIDCTNRKSFILSDFIITLCPETYYQPAKNKNSQLLIWNFSNFLPENNKTIQVEEFYLIEPSNFKRCYDEEDSYFTILDVLENPLK